MLLTDIPDLDVLLAFPPEDLAPILLKTALEDKKAGIPISVNSLGYRIFESERHKYESRFPPQRRREFDRAVGEAWEILRAERVLIPEAGINGQNGIMELSRKGQEFLARPAEFRGFKGAAMPKSMLHPAIAEAVWKALARGDLETAVLEAFRAVEIAVREVGKFKPEDVGVQLMRRAFDLANGPLTDKALPDAERDALSHLFAGAIGYYKNPQSHREAKIPGLERAQAIVMFASLLLQIIDDRRR